ncbi:hypothetical protein ACFC0M_28540 [Streptomyces sp. NPDC056149]|uniref:hypothetical protein n=1 Tax=Streptomyces sp. NPDC056149 TaxID=3345728 RepID=UPI0035DB2C7A
MMPLAMSGSPNIGAADLCAIGPVGAVLAFTTIVVCGVTLSPLLRALLGERTTALLRRAKDFLETHNASVMTMAITEVGTALITEGRTMLCYCADLSFSERLVHQDRS